MVKFFTLFLSHQQTNNKQLNTDEDYFEPSEQSVRSILDFAAAYEPLDLKNCEEKDIILN